ncbi:MAG: sulfite exporter TauE/SafE family protein [Kofleriaceae bacterium]
MSVALLAGMFAIGLVAFTTEGAIGFGATVIAVSLGAQLLPIEALLPAFVPINMALSTWLLLRGRGAVAWRLLLATIAPPVVIGTGVGMALFHLAPRTAMQLAFAGFVVVLALLELRRVLAPTAPVTARPLPVVTRVLVLGLGGVAHGLFATGGPLIIYVLRRGLTDKTAFRATLAVLWLSLNVLVVTNLAVDGQFRVETAGLGAVLVAALVPGLALGERLHRRLDPLRFERAVWGFLLVAGLALGVRTALALG